VLYVFKIISIYVIEINNRFKVKENEIKVEIDEIKKCKRTRKKEKRRKSEN